MLEVTIINYKKGCGRESVLCVLQLSCIFVPKIYLQFTKVRTASTDFVFGFRMAGIIKTWISVPNEKKRHRLFYGKLQFINLVSKNYKGFISSRSSRILLYTMWYFYAIPSRYKYEYLKVILIFFSFVFWNWKSAEKWDTL